MLAQSRRQRSRSPRKLGVRMAKRPAAATCIMAAPSASGAPCGRERRGCRERSGATGGRAPARGARPIPAARPAPPPARAGLLPRGSRTARRPHRRRARPRVEALRDPALLPRIAERDEQDSGLRLASVSRMPASVGAIRLRRREGVPGRSANVRPIGRASRERERGRRLAGRPARRAWRAAAPQPAPSRGQAPAAGGSRARSRPFRFSGNGAPCRRREPRSTPIPSGSTRERRAPAGRPRRAPPG